MCTGTSPRDGSRAEDAAELLKVTLADTAGDISGGQNFQVLCGTVSRMLDAPAAIGMDGNRGDLGDRSEGPAGDQGESLPAVEAAVDVALDVESRSSSSGT